MSLPFYNLMETPILHELAAVGGKDEVRYLYQRLISYFPSLSDAEINLILNGEYQSWKKAVQKAGKSLSDQKKISRNNGLWQITSRGREIVSSENTDFKITTNENPTLDHSSIQELIIEIGKILGYYAESEFEYYDVVWRESHSSKRLSHVFEVQSKGNIDSAFAKLKRAFDAQRSKLFLILASERDTNRANRSVENEFSELKSFITILGFAEIERTFRNLKEIEAILPKFLNG